MSFPHVFSGNPLLHPDLDARPQVHSGLTRRQRFANLYNIFVKRGT
jgi:hypothetical protein